MSAFWNSFGYGSVKPICLSANLLELFVGADMCKYVFYLCVARAGLRCVIRFSPPHWELVITMAVWSIRFSVGIYILPMNNEKQIGDHCCEVIEGFRTNTRAAEVQIPGHILVAAQWAQCSVACLHSSPLSRCFFIADCSHQHTELLLF